MKNDAPDKKLKPKLLDDSLASTIMKITFWPISILTLIACPINWIVTYNSEVSYPLKLWSDQTAILASIFFIYSLFRILYLKKNMVIRLR
ncbi:MAG: hypothetical protein QE263_02030 [Vampirovibrionales bacterium]|nr:hypothetical protein [Vampirovibrionales bacterium]